jgi:hypothetical protein
MSIMQTSDGYILPGYGPVLLIKRPVRTRMQGVVGLGEKNSRLPDHAPADKLTGVTYLELSHGDCCQLPLLNQRFRRGLVKAQVDYPESLY